MASTNGHATDRLQRGLTDASGSATAVLDRTRGEVVEIWREARARSKSWRPEQAEGRPPSSNTFYLAYYVGLGTIAALRLIEWRLAAIIAAAHTIERYGHRRRIQEFVEGLDAGV